MNDTINAIGVDLAKDVFQLYAVNRAEKEIFNKKVSRNQLINKIAQCPLTRIFMEACGGSHYWAKKFQELGHEVKLIAGQHVRKFVIGNKDDAIDARAIVTCGLRPETRFVPIKSEEQLEQQAIHRIRTRLVKERTAICCEVRSFLYEQGFVINKSRRNFEKGVKELLSSDKLRPTLHKITSDLFNEYLEKSELILKYEEQIYLSFAEDPRKKELEKIPGIGPLTSSALLAEASNCNEFKNGRNFSAFLGLVPKHFGSGGRNVNRGISKRGDSYIRTLLIHGARSALRHTPRRKDKPSLWCEVLKKRMPANKAAVALANKNARVAWRILSSNEEFNINKMAA